MKNEPTDWRTRHEAQLATTQAAKVESRAARREAWHTRHEAELAAAQATRASRREAHQTTYAESKLPINDPFTIESAKRQGITPQEFLDLVAERQREARQR